MGWKLLQPRERTILGFGLAATGIVITVIGSFTYLLFDVSTREVQVLHWAELGAIAAGAGLLFALAVRWMRRRMLSMAALKEAVLASTDINVPTSELQVAERFGSEAIAWNALLERLADHGASQAQGSSASTVTASAEERLALSVCSALWQGVVVIGEDLRARYANPAAAMLVGVNAEVLREKPITEFLDISGLLDESGKVRRGSIEIDRGQDASATQLRISVRLGREGDSSVLVIEDVTQQNAAEQARANFIAHATHELRTPLTNMRLYAETALSDDCDEAMLGTCLNVINQEVRRLERVVSDMLSVSEMEAGALSIQEGDARLDQLIDELRQEFEPQAQAKDITLNFTLPPKLPVVKGDRDKLLQAFHNVLGNAIKYTPEGGEVSFEADWGDDSLSISVRDTGVGIGQDDRQRIFDRFFRTDEVRSSGTQGTGLGLTLAKEIMLSHEGAIDVDSTPGKGSLFTMSLPGTRLVA